MVLALEPHRTRDLVNVGNETMSLEHRKPPTEYMNHQSVYVNAKVQNSPKAIETGNQNRGKDQ